MSSSSNIGPIYVLDDDPDLRDALVCLIVSGGYTARAFSTSDEFLEASNAEAPACAVVDICMPGVSGIELLSIMQMRKMGIPVVMVTGHSDLATAVQSMKLGAVDVIQKPFQQDSLLKAISSATGQAAGRGVESPIQDSLGREMQQRLRSLSPREREILGLIVKGQSSREIAAHLGIGVATVNNHRTQIKMKMSARTVAHLLSMVSTVGKGAA